MNPIDLNDIGLKDIYNVYAILHERSGLHHKLLGRVVITPQEIHVLSDYHGCLAELEGMNDSIHQRRWRSWQNGSHTLTVSLEDLKSGLHPQLLEEKQLPQTPSGPRESWFQVHRPDLEQPLLIQFLNGQGHMNNQPLSEEELTGLLSTSGVKIRHHRPMKKSELLEKMSPDLEAAFAAMKTSGIDPKHLETLHREIFMDPMTPGIKNKKSFEADSDALHKKPGTHIMIDGGSFGNINKIHGHAAGDEAIRTMGRAIRESVDETVSPGHPDVYRFGGDEFSLHVPTPAHAAHFFTTLRSKLEAIPAIGGQHKINIQAGMGTSQSEADKALNEHAKPLKNKIMKEKGLGKGADPTVAHSLVPGHVGPVGVSEPAPINPGPEVPAPKPPGT